MEGWRLTLQVRLPMHSYLQVVGEGGRTAAGGRQRGGGCQLIADSSASLLQLLIGVAPFSLFCCFAAAAFCRLWMLWMAASTV